MHVSSPDLTCVALGQDLAGVGGGPGAADGQGSPHLTSASLLFPRPAPRSPTLLQAPEQRRKQTPRLASPQWPRRGWRSSRIAAGPPSAESCSPHAGCPRGHGDPLPPSCLQSPHFTGAQELSKAEGIEGKPVTAAKGPAAQSMPNPGVCLPVYPTTRKGPPLKKVLSPLLASCISPTVRMNWERGMIPRCVQV